MILQLDPLHNIHIQYTKQSMGKGKVVLGAGSITDKNTLGTINGTCICFFFYSSWLVLLAFSYVMSFLLYLSIPRAPLAPDA